MIDDRAFASLNGRHILVAGGDHHNTLASVRSFGRAYIDFDLMLHPGVVDDDSLLVAASRYCPSDCMLVGNDRNSVTGGYSRWLTNKDPRRCLILSSSDLAAFVADVDFADKGVLTYFFDGQPGCASVLMDKFEQYRWMKSHDIPMATTAEVADSRDEAKGLGFPRIVKSLVSAFGEKTDIAIVETLSECNEVVFGFFSSGYERLLVQEIVDFAYEVVSVGCIFRSSGDEYNIALRKNRTFPSEGWKCSTWRLLPGSRYRAPAIPHSRSSISGRL